MSETEKLFVKFGVEKGGFFGGYEFFIYIEPASKVDLTSLMRIYKNKATLSPGKLGRQDGYPNGITIWFGSDKADNGQRTDRAIIDVNRCLELEQGWEKYSENRTAPIVGEFSYRRVQTGTGDGEPHQSTELLRQLSSLRDAGILTEEEFQTKKTEILKRL